MVKAIHVADRGIGPGLPCLIVAEAGVNHNGDPVTARRMVDVAADAGVDAVKFQAFKAEHLVAPNAPKAAYQIAATGKSESQMDMLRRLELPDEAYDNLITLCSEKGVLFMCTPFDEQSADFLETLDTKIFKIPSGELTNLSFLAHVARKSRPMIVSTGMANLEEVATAVGTIRENGDPPLILLHCVSNYPADPADANLGAIQTLIEEFHVPVGYSDHTPGIEVALAAVALGACLIEKHFTLDRKMPGPDHLASIEPNELRTLVNGIRTVESALGHGRKEPASSEADIAAVARKSLVAARDIPSGTTLTDECIAILRPGTGLPPDMKLRVVGRTTREKIPAGTLFTLGMLE